MEESCKTSEKKETLTFDEQIDDKEYTEICNILEKKYESQTKALTWLGLAMACGLITIILVIATLIFPAITKIAACFMIALIFFSILGCILAYNSDKSKIPEIDDLGTLLCYLKYLTKDDLNKYKYASTMAWISIRVRQREGKISQDKQLNKLVELLYPILKPFSNKNGHCEATYRKKEFTEIVENILSSKKVKKGKLSKRIKDFKNQPKDINLDFNIWDLIQYLRSHISYIVFLAIIFIHALAIVLKYGGESILDLSFKNVFSNPDARFDIATILPTDILALLIYTGFVKETRE